MCEICAAAEQSDKAAEQPVIHNVFKMDFVFFTQSESNVNSGLKQIGDHFLHAFAKGCRYDLACAGGRKFANCFSGARFGEPLGYLGYRFSGCLICYALTVCYL